MSQCILFPRSLSDASEYIRILRVNRLPLYLPEDDRIIQHFALNSGGSAFVRKFSRSSVNRFRPVGNRPKAKELAIGLQNTATKIDRSSTWRRIEALIPTAFSVYDRRVARLR
jgi:hypothetical protein